MNIKEITARLDVLTALSKEDQAKNTWLSGTVRMKIAHNIATLAAIYGDFEKDRVALIKKLGEPADGTVGNFVVKDEGKLKEFNALIEVELAKDHKVELEEITEKQILGKAGDNQFTLSLLTDLLTLGLVTK